MFEHGVASGDPLAHRVVLWTRVTPADETASAVSVSWRVSTDPNLRAEVVSGEATATRGSDWTVHVDATGLEPATTYWYRFEADGATSPTGRTRTAPGRSTESVRIGVVSCSSLAVGYFNVYRRLADRDVDFIVHLGDYIYEQPGDAVRPHEPPHELVSLADYRVRHAQYRKDPDLQELHRLHPVVAIWDDHDVAGNGWVGGASAHDAHREGPWEERLAAGRQAWTEWLPVRLPVPGDPARIYRHLPLGSLADLLLLDTRFEGRHEQVDASTPEPEAVLTDPTRRLMSDAQWQWLEDRLRDRNGRWVVLGNQVMLSPLTVSDVPQPLLAIARGIGTVIGDTVLNPDQWDGYPTERERLFQALRATASPDVAVLTGDIHSSWAAELSSEGGPVGVEMVVPSASSETFAEVIGPSVVDAPNLVTGLFRSEHPQIRWADIRRHGYAVVEVTRDSVQADWWHVPTVERQTDEETLAASWGAARGEGRLVETEPLGARPADGADSAPGAATRGRGQILIAGAVAGAAVLVGAGIAVRRRVSRR